jgi:hypothetical protein
MSLFERIQNKRYDLQEKKKRYQKKVDHGFGNDSGKKTGGFEDITGEGIKTGDYPKTRKELEAKRKEYGINKDGVPSKEGIKRYAEKAKQLKSGSNVPVNVTQDDLDKARERMVGGKPVLTTGTKGVKDKIGTTTGRYGGRLANKRPKNAPSYAEVKAKIDAKNPVIQTPIGPLPKTAKNMKKFPQPSFKNFVKKTASKGVNKFKSLGFRGKAGVIGAGIAAAYLGGEAIKKALTPKDTLTARDFKKSKSPVTKKDGSEVRRSLFLSTKQEKNNKEPRISGDRLTRNKNFTAKLKSGEYRTS